jgi:spore maturation protein CgeB
MSNFSLLRAIKGKSCFGKKLNTLYNSSKLVLSIIAKPEHATKTQSGINMRPYEILASGSLLFSDNYDELHPELINNQNLVLFNNVDEFKKSLIRLLNNPHEIEKISAKGRQFIEDRFSYDEMAKVILAKFNELKTTKPNSVH